MDRKMAVDAWSQDSIKSIPVKVWIVYQVAPKTFSLSDRSFCFLFKLLKFFVQRTMDCGVHSVDRAVDQTADQTMVHTVDSTVVKSRIVTKKWFEIPGCVRIMAGIMDIEYFRIYQNCFNLFLFVFWTSESETPLWTILKETLNSVETWTKCWVYR